MLYTLILILCVSLCGCDLFSFMGLEEKTEGESESDRGACAGGHTFDDGESYIVPGGIDRATVYTCTVCGEKKTESYVFNEDIYSISVTKGEDLLLSSFSMPKKARSGKIIEIKTDVIMDADIDITVNGQSISKSHYDSDYWGYTFIMPNDDVEIAIEISDGFIASDVTYLSCFEEWLSELDASQINEINQKHTYIGVAPGSLSDTYYTTEKSEISRLLGQWQDLSMTAAQESDTLISGGSSTRTTFTLNDGTQYSITLSNGFYHTDNDLYFHINIIPHINDERVTLTTYSFIAYKDTYKLYNADELIGEYTGISEYEFVEYDGPITLNIPTTYIECEFGTLRLYNSTLFSYVDMRGELAYYTVIGDKNFSFAFE